jgi:hypothetical protein
MLAKHARSGQGQVSKALRAREGDITKQFEPDKQPRVPSNIPGSGPQGVPPATADKMAEFARTGNMNLIPTIVNVQTGLATHGPAIVSSLARMGGQVRLAPGQFRVWAHPQDAKDLTKPSDQTQSPPPAKSIY